MSAVAQEFRWIASLLPLLTGNLASPWSLWVYVTDASGGTRGGFGVTRRKCETVQPMPFDRAVFQNVPSVIQQPCFGGVWRKPCEILRREGKDYVMELRHVCRSTECQ